MHVTVNRRRQLVITLEDEEDAALIHFFLGLDPSCNNKFSRPEIHAVSFEGPGDHPYPQKLCFAVEEEIEISSKAFMRDLVHELFAQGCQIHPNSSDDPIKEFQYDHSCLSTYEEAQRVLLEWGMLKPEQCVRK